MGREISKEEKEIVEVVGKLIANKIRSTIIDANKLYGISGPSFPRIFSMLIVAIIDVVQDFADAHKLRLTEEITMVIGALEYAAKIKEKHDNENKEKEDNKEDGKE